MFTPFDHQKQSLLRHLPSEQIHKMLLSGEFCIQAYPKDTIIHRADDLINRCVFGIGSIHRIWYLVKEGLFISFKWL